MKRLFVSAVAAALAASITLAGCTQAAPAPAPTQAPAAPAKAAEPTKAPAAPAKAAEPTKAPAAQPTAAPAPKVAFPEKGKPITLITPYAAGGSTDINSRLLAPLLEKELGTSVQVVNKPGASTQVATTELFKAKPDGYTLGIITLPSTLLTYLDPERKAEYSRKDFQPVSMFFSETYMVAVQAESPYKTLEEFRTAARASSGNVKVGTAGLMTASHLTTLTVAKALGASFAVVHFDGAAPAMVALLGGHLDAAVVTAGSLQPHFNSGKLRILGIVDQDDMKSFPGVKTMEALGYKAYGSVWYGFAAPAGTPKEVVQVLTDAYKKILGSPDFQKKLEESGTVPRYMDPDKFATFWAEMEPTLKPLLEEAKQK